MTNLVEILKQHLPSKATSLGQREITFSLPTNLPKEKALVARYEQIATPAPEGTRFFIVVDSSPIGSADADPRILGHTTFKSTVEYYK